MLVTVLYRMEGSPTISQPAGFTDLRADWYADSVAWGAANGIVKGYDEKTFGPDDLVTREQIAAILHRYAQYKGYAEGETGNLTPFTDASQISDWAHENMIWAVGRKLITGRTADTLAPKATATRAEAAKILVTFTEQQAI